MLGFVKSAQDKCDGPSLREIVPAVALEELRKAMLEFVESLAIADARRDHLVSIDSSIDRSTVIDSDHVQKAPKI